MDYYKQIFESYIINLYIYLNQNNNKEIDES